MGIRVLVNYCLAERLYNPYYLHVTTSLVHISKNHRTTLRLTLWDYFKQIKHIDLHSTANLSLFVTALLINGTISMSTLKVVRFEYLSEDIEISFWRICLKQVLEACSNLDDVTKLFGRTYDPSRAQQSNKKENSIHAGLRLF